jgi:hypothetical protein
MPVLQSALESRNTARENAQNNIKHIIQIYLFKILSINYLL